MAIGVFWRLIPHIPNMTPLVGLSLFAGAYLNRGPAFSIILAVLFISDLGLALIFGYPVVGYYTFFTYTGFLGVILLGSGVLDGSKWRFPAYILGSSFGFWIWTNFGVWLTAPFYTKNLDGLIACYNMAIPFLRNAIFGDLIWSCLIFGIFYILLNRKRAESICY